MDVVILCGGRGTRLQERTAEIPKPLVEIGGTPIVAHVMRLYAEQGLTSFVLATGYKGHLIEAFVAAHARAELGDDVEVRCVDTGLDTPTGGRLLAAAGHVRGERFCATYADGLADVDLQALLRFHDDHGEPATMTVVRPELPFGVTDLDDDVVTGFQEKPRSEHWINGGFFVFDRAALAYLQPGSVLEREPLERLAADRRLRAYRHEGFWECMDTYKDAVALNDLWATGDAPWRVVHR